MGNIARKPIDVTKMFPQVVEIRNDELRRAVISVWEELWEEGHWEDVEAVPTATSLPYPTLQHNRCVLTMALAVADALESHHGTKINRDILIAAGILQDAGKVREYMPTSDGGIAFTPSGRLYPHAFWAAHIAVKKGIPEEVVHIIFTHSLISPQFPESIEGQILHYVDVIDATAISQHPFVKEVSSKLRSRS